MRGLAKLEVEDLVRGSFLEGAPIIEVSSKTGAGLDALKSALERAAQSVPGKDAGRHFRLPIDRAFVMKGFGTVVTGTLVSGSVRTEDEVELFPVQRCVRVRGLHSGGSAVTQAVAGQRTAVNLAGVELEDLHRGMSLAAPGKFLPTKRLDARLELLPSTPALKNRSRVHLHHGTTEIIADVLLLEGEKLAPGQRAFAQLRLTEPILALSGDRFIIRRFSPVTTIGGGAILDPLAPLHRRKDANTIPLLATLERSDKDAIVAVLAAAEPRGLSLARLIARTGWLESETRDVIKRLTAKGALAVLEEEPLSVISASAVAALLPRIRQELEKFHRANPLVLGVAKEDLRGKAGAKPEIFRAALAQLVAQRAISLSGDLVQSAGREIALLPEEAKAKELIASEFDHAGLTVPRFEEVLGKLPVEKQRAQKLLQLLLREKTLIKIADDLVFHQSAVTRLREMVANYKKTKGPQLPIGTFKDLTGVTRKYAIPLLEYLDRERVTRRVGDERVIL